MGAEEEVAEMKKLLQKETLLRNAAEEEVENLKSQLAEWKRSEVCFVPLIAFLVVLVSLFAS